MNELPTMLSSTYQSHVHDMGFASAGEPDLLARNFNPPGVMGALDGRRLVEQANNAIARQQAQQLIDQHQAKETKVTTRIVRVIIMDPNESIPLNDRVLFKGDEQLTDLTDQELFFEIDVAGALRSHNEKRARTLDKKASERSGKDVFLEPARIRDLKMVVVNVATF